VNPERIARLRELVENGALSNRTGYSDEEIAGLHASYLASVKYSDRLVGELIERLAARAGERGLVVVLTADHGENLAEHGDDAIARHFGPWSTSLRIPLVVADSRVDVAGVRDGRLASHQRVPRLFLDAADQRLPREPGPWSESVGRALHLDPAFIYSEPWLVLVDDSLKVAIDRTDLAAPPLVHRWREDFEDQSPQEVSDAARVRWEELMEVHQQMLEAGRFEPPADIDPEKLEHLRALGYVE
jgi:arylsulfatase A-like enzyme